MSKTKTKSRKPRKYKPTPIGGSFFDLWLLDTKLERIFRVDRRLTWEESLYLQGEWMKDDHHCIPVIVRNGYRIPNTITCHRDDTEGGAS